MIAAIFALFAVVFGAFRRVDVYAEFVEGAQEGLKTALRVTPYLCAALLLIGALRGSGALDLLQKLLEPLLKSAGIPAEMLPFLLLRPVSGSGALSALRELMERTGPDSRASFLAAAMMGSSETVLYVIGVYLGSVRMRSARYCVWAALLSMTAGMAVVLLFPGST